MTAVSLREWEVSSPQPGGALYETFLSDEAGRKFAGELTKTGRLGILELARGVELRATSFVGRISLGGLTITVRPKIAEPTLLRLFRYAYGLRNVHLYDSARYGSAAPIFQDLLIHQLLAETRELLERGIQREYERAHGELANPRGRIDFARYAKQPNPARAALPCVFHPRTEDTLLNQVLLAGLELASRMAVDGILKSDARHLSKLLSAGVRTVQLNSWILTQAVRNLDRRTSAYKPAFEVIQILLEESGVSLDDGLPRTRLPGFLFDMNRFFQKLISRFLHEHLSDVEVRDEFRLKEMFSYDPAHNPHGRRNPIVRPDFVLVRGGETVSVLDAKYRDLWDQPLPRDMLYQLSLYALGRTGGNRRSVILYPALETSAREQRIRIREPSVGTSQASVILRPVVLGRLCELIEGGPTMRAKASDYAEQLALR